MPVLRYLVPRLVDGMMVNSRTTLATIRPGRTPVILATPPIELDGREFHEPGDEVRRVVMLGACRRGRARTCSSERSRACSPTDGQAYVVGGALFGEERFQADLEELVADLGIQERVHFVGHVEDPWAWLVDADVLVHCSRIPEPFGQVVVQGMWARCAVVAAQPGGPAEVVTDGRDGLLVPGGDERALGDALVRLRDDVDLRRALARQARETARSFDAVAAAPPLASWICELRAGRVPPGSRATSVIGLLRPEGDGPQQQAGQGRAGAGTFLDMAPLSATVRPVREARRTSMSRPRATTEASTAATMVGSGSRVKVSKAITAIGMEARARDQLADDRAHGDAQRAHLADQQDAEPHHRPRDVGHHRPQAPQPGISAIATPTSMASAAALATISRCPDKRPIVNAEMGPAAASTAPAAPRASSMRAESWYSAP